MVVITSSTTVRPTVLTEREESPLLWFFSRGQVVSERSVAGSMLFNHSMYNPQAIKHENEHRTALVARLAKEMDEDPVIVRQRLGLEVVEYVDTAEENITAQITAEHVVPNGFEPRHAEMETWATISRVVMKMASGPAGGRHLLAFSEYYGDSGARFHELEQCARDPHANAVTRAFRGHGRHAALYRLTAHGARLLEWEEELRAGRGQPPSAGSQQERMEQSIQYSTAAGHGPAGKVTKGRYASLTMAQEREIRQQMLTKARREAEPIYWAACWAWREVL